MTGTEEANVRYMAERAKALLDDSVLAAAWAEVEAGYIEQALATDATDDQRREFAYRVNALRDVRDRLKSHVQAGASLSRSAASASNRLP